MANDRRRALITGASSGIGLELARLMAADGWRLVLSARNEAALRALAALLGGDAEVLPADLAAPDAAARLADAATAGGRPVDALINNAGYGALGDFLVLDAAGPADMLRVN